MHSNADVFAAVFEVWALCCLCIAWSLGRYEHLREAGWFLLGAMGCAVVGVLIMAFG